LAPDQSFLVFLCLIALLDQVVGKLLNNHASLAGLDGLRVAPQDNGLFGLGNAESDLALYIS
jgi:hypothetical protein